MSNPTTLMPLDAMSAAVGSPIYPKPTTEIFENDKMNLLGKRKLKLLIVYKNIAYQSGLKQNLHYFDMDTILFGIGRSASTR